MTVTHLWRSVLAAIGAATVAYPVNRFIQRRFGVRPLLATSPLWEETAKVASIYIAGGLLTVVHMLFGLIEAIADWYGGNNENGARNAILSVLSHGIFTLSARIGVFAYVAAWCPGRECAHASVLSEMAWAWAAALIAHFLWNGTVMMIHNTHYAPGVDSSGEGDI